jgi:anti-anti-sigma factor
MSIYSDNTNGILLLRPQQNVDFDIANEMQERLSLAPNDGIAFVIIDFSSAALVSTAALRVILDAASKMREHRGCIAIAGASEQFRSLLVVADIPKIVPVFHSIKEAQAHLLAFADDRNSLPDDDGSGS